MGTEKGREADGQRKRKIDRKKKISGSITLTASSDNAADKVSAGKIEVDEVVQVIQLRLRKTKQYHHYQYQHHRHSRPRRFSPSSHYYKHPRHQKVKLTTKSEHSTMLPSCRELISFWVFPVSSSCFHITTCPPSRRIIRDHSLISSSL
ncbi:hypothetical protein PoB_002291600 [Plakobranchus ocellatus]|uniref:Uncharacterized protein n=1 Tax=Plakobranchus ocellatus TaxID=259542 RepID=A0AAV3ZAW2_9GAST|nr:hypothetical protein PoB_002291600 [Plakobranchus ocellatus]